MNESCPKCGRSASPSQGLINCITPTVQDVVEHTTVSDREGLKQMLEYMEDNYLWNSEVQPDDLVRIDMTKSVTNVMCLMLSVGREVCREMGGLE